MAHALPIKIKIRTGRRALCEMFIDLTLAFHATTATPPGAVPRPEIDANLILVAVATMLGHVEGRPMNASQIAARLQMPRTSVLRRLETLTERGLIQRIEGRYYIEPIRAETAPLRDRFELILTKGFAVLGPILSKTDT